MIRRLLLTAVIGGLLAPSCANRRKLPALSLENGIVVTQSGSGYLELESRLVTGDPDAEGHYAGAPGTLRFEVSASASFADVLTSGWEIASPENGFTVRARIDGLEPGTRYHCRARFGATARHTYLSGVISAATAAP